MTLATTNAARVLKVLIALRGHTITGLSNQDLARGLNESPSAITRALQNLIEAGLAVKLDNGRFAHSVQMLQIAQAHAQHIVQLQNRISEVNQRIAAGALN